MQKELKSRQLCFIYLAFAPLAKLFIMPSVLSSHSGEDLWISALLNLVLDFICLTFTLFTAKRAKTDFFTLLEDNLGKFVRNIILIVFFFYFMVKAFIPINEQKDYVEMTLYTLSPRIFYFLPFFILAFYFCTKSLRAIGRIADVLWFFTILGLLLLFSLSVPNCDFYSLLPIGANGITNISKGWFSSLLWFGDSVYFLFFIGEFTYKKGDTIKILASQVISGILILAFLIIFYSVFTSIAHRQRFALTEISKYATVINNIGRFDYLGIMLLLFSNLFSMSLPLFFATRILNRLCNFRKNWIAPIITVGAQFLLTLLLTERLSSIENLLMHCGGYLFLIVGNVLPIILNVIFLRRKKYETAKS